MVFKDKRTSRWGCFGNFQGTTKTTHITLTTKLSKLLSNNNLINERRYEWMKINAIIANSEVTCFDSLVGIKR